MITSEQKITLECLTKQYGKAMSAFCIFHEKEDGENLAKAIQELATYLDSLEE